MGRMQRVGATTFAYVQGDGSWGWSNSGLVAGERESLLVDTLFDLKLTHALLDAVAHVTTAPIRTLVNTHHNGDHCYGNQLVRGATIVGHRLCRAEMVRSGPPTLLSSLKDTDAGGGVIGYLKRAFAAFDFTGIEIVPPTIVFDDSLTVGVEGRDVDVMHLGPGHTLGDVVAWIADERVLLAGDLVFRGSTPLVWEGSISNWIAALDRMIALEPAIVVPGHGPVGGPEALVEMRGYLERVLEQGRELKAQGLEPLEAARRFDRGPYRDWLDGERIALNLMRLWKELDGEPPDARISALDAFAAMAEIAAG